MAMRHATSSGTSSDLYGLFMMSRYAIAPSSQLTVPSSFSSPAMATAIFGMSVSSTV